MRQISQACSANSGKIRKAKAKQTCWKIPGRCNDWWKKLQMSQPRQEWKENLRMLRANFHKICNELWPFISRQVTNMRSPVPVETIDIGGIDC